MSSKDKKIQGILKMIVTYARTCLTDKGRIVPGGLANHQILQIRVMADDALALLAQPETPAAETDRLAKLEVSVGGALGRLGALENQVDRLEDLEDRLTECEKILEVNGVAGPGSKNWRGVVQSRLEALEETENKVLHLDQVKGLIQQAKQETFHALGSWRHPQYGTPYGRLQMLHAAQSKAHGPSIEELIRYWWDAAHIGAPLVDVIWAYDQPDGPRLLLSTRRGWAPAPIPERDLVKFLAWAAERATATWQDTGSTLSLPCIPRNCLSVNTDGD